MKSEYKLQISWTFQFDTLGKIPGGALDFQMVGVCRWGVENRTLS